VLPEHGSASRCAGCGGLLRSASATLGHVEAARFTAIAAGLDLPEAFAQLTQRFPDGVYNRLAPAEILSWYPPHLFAEIFAPAWLADLHAVLRRGGRSSSCPGRPVSTGRHHRKRGSQLQPAGERAGVSGVFGWCWTTAFRQRFLQMALMPSMLTMVSSCWSDEVAPGSSPSSAQ